jgi:hypothetical protein
MTNIVGRRLLDVAQSRATARDVIMKNKLREGQTLLGIQAYTYVTQWTNVAAAAAGTSVGTTNNIQTQGNTDFLILYLSGQVYNNATQAAITSPLARLQVSDNVTNLPMFNIPAYFSLSCGNTGFPYILQDPRLISATTIIQCTLFNDSTVGPIAMDAQVTFGGYRAMYAG